MTTNDYITENDVCTNRAPNIISVLFLFFYQIHGTIIQDPQMEKKTDEKKKIKKSISFSKP